MLFPRHMFRLTWFLPQQCLAEGLQRLAHTGVFHLSEHVLLGKAGDLQSLKQAYHEKLQAAQQETCRRLMQHFPEDTLLNYRMGKMPTEMLERTHIDGVLVLDEGLFLWAGEGELPESLTPYLFSETMIEAPSLLLHLDDQQWQLLLATATRIGHVGPWAVIDGWIPAGEKDRLSGLLGDEAVCLCPAEETGLPYEDVPVQYERPAWLEGFGTLMQNFGLTGYRELDPTILLAGGFVLMFGMMFADMGQGLILSMLGLLLLHTVKKQTGPDWIHGKAARTVGKVLVPIGLSAAFFGALFGSFFAFEDLFPALWFHPLDQVLFYLAASIGIGMATITLGLALGLLNAIRMRRFHQMFWDKFGFMGLVFYIGFILLALSIVRQNADLGLASALLCAVPLMALMFHQYWVNKVESVVMRLFLGLLEGFDLLMKFFVHTLSFARIAAFTLAHVGLSKAVMLIADALANWPLLAISTIVFGNIFIIVLEGLLVSIQVVRLHFFEFFTKFVVGGGKAYKPLTLKEVVKC